MRKKCVICGIDIDEDVAVCPKCGMQNPTENPEFQVIPKQTPTVSKKPARKGLPFILGGVAVVIVAAVVLLLNLFGGASNVPPASPSSPPTLLDNHLAFRNGDVDKLDLLAPDEYWEYWAQKENEDKDLYLRSQKISYSIANSLHPEEQNKTESGEVLSAMEMNAEALRQLSQMLFEIYGIPESSVTAGTEVTIQWTIITPYNSRKSSSEELLAVEIHDSWYLVKYVEIGGDVTVVFYKG